MLILIQYHNQRSRLGRESHISWGKKQPQHVLKTS